MGLATRAKASQLKAATMAAFGVWVLGRTGWGLWTGNLPDAMTMGSVALLALAANAAVAAMLYVYREGDSNMRSVWICSRNDAIGNVAVVLAAVGVFGTASGLPDLIVAGVMATLALSGAWQMWRYAQQDLRHAATI
jgi:Co/Zn/Cd efflux system component